MSLQHTEKKPLPKAVEWQVQQLRLTVFTGEGASFSPEDWWVNLVGSPPDSVVARPKEGLFQQEGAFEGRKLLLRAQADKNYSLCDALSFVVMERLRITDALAFDRHFRQYGRVNVLA